MLEALQYAFNVVQPRNMKKTSLKPSSTRQRRIVVLFSTKITSFVLLMAACHQLFTVGELVDVAFE